MIGGRIQTVSQQNVHNDNLHYSAPSRRRWYEISDGMQWRYRCQQTTAKRP